mgnify:CR=1 FL=1
MAKKLKTIETWSDLRDQSIISLFGAVAVSGSSVDVIIIATLTSYYLLSQINKLPLLSNIYKYNSWLMLTLSGILFSDFHVLIIEQEIMQKTTQLVDRAQSHCQVHVLSCWC